MPRATITVEADRPAEGEAVDAWFARWQPRLSFMSDNQGCGCCVDIWEVEAPAEALAELPQTCCSAGQAVLPQD